MMIAVDDQGYGAFYITPSQILDFSGRTQTVTFDVSTLRNSIRDWFDLWVTPFNEYLTAPLHSNLIVDLQGRRTRSIFRWTNTTGDRPSGRRNTAISPLAATTGGRPMRAT